MFSCEIIQNRIYEDGEMKGHKYVDRETAFFTSGKANLAIGKDIHPSTYNE